MPDAFGLLTRINILLVLRHACEEVFSPRIRIALNYMFRNGLIELVATSLLLFSQLISASASRDVKTGSPSSWILPVTYQNLLADSIAERGSVRYLLVDRQDNVETQERYRHFAMKLVTADGVQEMSDFEFIYDPMFETLTIHGIQIHRNGNVINKFRLADLEVIQREGSAERSQYDGRLTAILHLNDVRIGDIVEYEYTIAGNNPIYGDHFNAIYDLEFSIPVDRVITRLVAPASKPVMIRTFPEEKGPDELQRGAYTEYVWDRKKLAPLFADNNLPPWYMAYGYASVSTFDSWNGVTSAILPHYKVSGADKKRLKKALADWEKEEGESITLERLIRFVQDDIRYLGLEGGLSAYRPHNPVQVWEQRYGDCKDKSLLLSTLLQMLGFDAFPVLVNTTIGKAIEEQSPGITAFDHCVVGVQIEDGYTYIDPTIPYQGGDFGEQYFPRYERGLFVRSGERGLRNLQTSNSRRVGVEETYKLGEPGEPVIFRIRTTYKGGIADDNRSRFAGTNLATIEREYLEYNSYAYSGIQITSLFVLY